jgi:succinate dehydrogenase / fumarate reductase flavoprotein subunit
MGGLWVDYNLMSNVPGLFVLGEANFSDHGANRLGASALMQGLADGYFIIPYTLGGYLAGAAAEVGADHAAFREAEEAAAARLNRLLAVKGKRTVDDFHRQLGLLMWDYCGMGRKAEGLRHCKAQIAEIREEFWQNVTVAGTQGEFNQVLERAGRVADFMEFAELLAHDALMRDESCGSHFREEHQTEEGEARRDDEHYAHVAAWEFAGVGADPILRKEALVFDRVSPSQRSYK